LLELLIVVVRALVAICCRNARSSETTFVAGLVDTSLLVYRFDPRFPKKQMRATELLRIGVADDSIRVPHQALMEFVAATTKPLTRNGPSLLSPDDARRELEEMLVQFEVLDPDEELVRVAIRGAATYRLSWFDAHVWKHENEDWTHLHDPDAKIRK